MFDFFFKRAAKKLDAPTPPAAAPQPDNASLAEKTKLLLQADALAGDEAAALEFLLQCRFADARLRAATHLQTPALLRQALQALRNTDRRVAKLLQGRLDAIQHDQQQAAAAQRCIEHARALQSSPTLLPNQLVELDRDWRVIQASAAAQNEFDTVRVQLAQRLQIQIDWQRRLLDQTTELNAARLKLKGDVILDDANAALAQARDCIIEAEAASELASLPKQLLPALRTQIQNLEQEVQQAQARQQVEQRCSDLMQRWLAQPLTQLQPTLLRQQWRQVSEEQVASAELQNRFDELLQQVGAAQPAPVRASERAAPDTAFAQTLADLQQALQAGELRTAIAHEKTLRAVDWKSIKSSAAHAQIAQARAELNQLRDWARWGGGVSRDGLLEAAEALAQQQLAPVALAKKVDQLRARWKNLDQSSGAAGKDAWQRFDRACSAAYVPAAAHFKQQAEQRQANLEGAQALIAEINAFAASALPPAAASPDYKNIAHYCARVEQQWQRLGAIARNQKQQLNSAFQQACERLRVPLRQMREREIQLREQLIDDAQRLSVEDRNAPERLRNLQQRWQQHAKSMPLESRDEQHLWQRFRAACDQFFARRQALGELHDSQQRQHLQQKEALCAELEHAALDSAQAAAALRVALDQWQAIGPVARDAQAPIEARFQAALEQLRQSQQRQQQHAQALQLDQVLQQLSLCQQLENAILQAEKNAADEQDWRQRWPDPASLPNQFRSVLQQRFDAGLRALNDADAGYATQLQNNQLRLQQRLLEIEIMSGCDSPAELATERLQLQIGLLQMSLKAGAKPAATRAHGVELCGLPAAIDPPTQQRLQNVMRILLAD